MPMWQSFLMQLRGRLNLHLLIYTAIAGTGAAMTMYERYQDRQVAAARLQAELAAARLQALRGHLQPHFLFNSLHSIAALARAGDTAGVVRLVGRAQRSAPPRARRRRSPGVAARRTADRRALPRDSTGALRRSARGHGRPRGRRRGCPRAAAHRSAARGERGAARAPAASARGIPGRPGQSATTGGRGSTSRTPASACRPDGPCTTRPARAFATWRRASRRNSAKRRRSTWDRGRGAACARP